MTRAVVFGALLATLSGCTYVITNQSPTGKQYPADAQLTADAPMPVTVGLRYADTPRRSLCGADMMTGFAGRLRQHNLFTDVLYEMRPTDRPDFVLETEFACTFDLNIGKMVLASVLNGATLLLTSPLPLYDYDMTVDATVVVRQGDQERHRYVIHSAFDSDFSFWASFRQSKHQELWRAAAWDAYDQIAEALRNDRARLEQLTGGASGPAIR